MDPSHEESIIMSAIIHLPLDLPFLRALSAELLLRHRRLAFLLLSPRHLSLALARLRSLPLPSKTLLLARLLLRSLSLLHSPLLRPPSLPLPHFDSAVLLLALSDSPSPRLALARLSLSSASLGPRAFPLVSAHLDSAVKCRRLMLAAGGGSGGGAAAGAVLSLDTVGDGECAICGEAVRYGAAMPCGHPYHWGCILEWLRMRNTCPCCRFELPTLDVYAEIRRVWNSLVKMGSR